jgi:hypothetical protein
MSLRRTEKGVRRLVSRKKAEPSGSMLPLPLQFLAAWLVVWFERVLQQQVDYLMAENKILKKRLGDRRLQLTDADRRRLAVLGKKMGLKVLARIATIAAPETIFQWYRELVAKKYDGSKRRGPGRPRKAEDLVELVLRMARESEEWGYTRTMGTKPTPRVVVSSRTPKPTPRVLWKARTSEAHTEGTLESPHQG